MGSTNLIICFTWVIVGLPCALAASDPAMLIDRLKQTRPVNINEIIDGQFKDAEPPTGFHVADPYGPDAAETVEAWFRDPRRVDEV